MMDIDTPSSISQSHLDMLENNHQLSDSPSFLPKGTIKTKGKSRPDFLRLRTTSSNSFKRPLSPSLSSTSIDSPTTMLAADISQNFHIEPNNQGRVITPKRSLFLSSMRYDTDLSINLEDTENRMDVILNEFGKSHNSQQQQQQQQQPQPFRKPFANLSTSRGSSTSSIATESSYSSALTSLSTVDAGFKIYNDGNNAGNLSSHSINSSISLPAKPRRTMRRAHSSHTFSNRNASMINGSLFQPSLHLLDDEDDDEDDTTARLDSLCVPSPIVEKLTPNTLSLINLQDEENDYEDVNDSNSDVDFNDEDSPSLKREVGSPIQQRITSKIKAARSKVRRTHSMFQNPQDYFMNDRNATSLINKISTNMTLLRFDNDNDSGATTLGNATIPKTSIKTVSDSKNLIPRINVDEFVRILDGLYSEFFDKVVVVDCRFEYEFEGGHIEGAINISSQKDLELEFLSKGKVDNEVPAQNKTLLIFHCEFSSYRGPLMANHLRKSDRLMNTDNYPNLFYPDILILEGGYKNFFDLQLHRCFPKCYVQMNDSQHQLSCEIQMNRVRRDSKLQSSRSLKKAKSFHIGLPNSQKIHARSRSQTILNSSTSSSMLSSSRPSSFQRATTSSTRHSSSLLSFSKHNSFKFSQRSSTHSLSSTTTNTTMESDEDLESDVLGSYLAMHREEDKEDSISSFFEQQPSTSQTLSSFLEYSNTSSDFRFPMKMSSNQSLKQQVAASLSNSTIVSGNASGAFKFGAVASSQQQPHQDTPFISHKKQKSSGYLCKTVTQPNLKF